MEQRLAEFRAKRAAQQRAEPASRSKKPEESTDKPQCQYGDEGGGARSRYGRLLETAAADRVVTSRSPGEDGRTSDATQLDSVRTTRRPSRSDRQESSWLQFVSVDRLGAMNVSVLKVLLWLVLLGLFAELQFGLLFFVLSLFYWMYVGMRGPSERQSGEPSAYSVFNPGCRPIQGTLTAEQFEGELGYKPLAGRDARNEDGTEFR
ncbi:SAYSvFN domain-containing protein 1 [Erpetoichthys calabaricus]|uniref:SAYSvFN domain-containing protein 1 n=1 Tax=Erpetoichthys calabaricus TaxID=27687 RepID=UPI0022344E59|nr:SAYSvFN domain-containing protein 1 [Erpetoichthys calabaricus]